MKVQSLHILLLFTLLVSSCADNFPIPEFVEDLKVSPEGQNLEQKEIGEIFCNFEEIQAEFPEGMHAWKDYMKKNTQYFQEGIEGKVFLSFIVNETGKISEVKVMRGIDSEVDQYAIALIKNSPDWTPCERLGKPVKSRMHIMIRFPMNQSP